MRTLGPDTDTKTTKELLENAIDGIRSKHALLHIAALQEQNSDFGKLIAYQAEIIQNAMNSLKELRGKL